MMEMAFHYLHNGSSVALFNGDDVPLFKEWECCSIIYIMEMVFHLVLRSSNNGNGVALFKF